MSQFTQQQLLDFWWGVGGSETSPTSGAYVLMTDQQVQEAQNSLRDSYRGETWSQLLAYVSSQQLFGFSDYSDPPVSNRKYIGGHSVFNGPIRSILI